MSKTPDEVQAMKEEIEAWLAQNGLTKTVYWRDVQEFFAERKPPDWLPIYLVFSYDDEFNDARRGAHSTLPKNLMLELDDIVRRHGCGMESYESWGTCLLAVYDKSPQDDEE